jgi:hypothetical protein
MAPEELAQHAMLAPVLPGLVASEQTESVWL